MLSFFFMFRYCRTLLENLLSLINIQAFAGRLTSEFAPMEVMPVRAGIADVLYVTDTCYYALQGTSRIVVATVPEVEVGSLIGTVVAEDNVRGQRD